MILMLPVPNSNMNIMKQYLLFLFVSFSFSSLHGFFTIRKHINPIHYKSIRSLSFTTSKYALQSNESPIISTNNDNNPLESKCAMGIDFGTTGIRICITKEGNQHNITSNNNLNDVSIIYEDKILYQDLGYSSTQQSYLHWIHGLTHLFQKYQKNSLSSIAHNSIHSLCLCGTSASCLLFDIETQSISRDVRMYDYDVLKTNHGIKAMNIIQQYCPNGSPTNASTSTLAKLISWDLEDPIKLSEKLISQADLMNYFLLNGNVSSAYANTSTSSGNPFISDWHNSLKVGYDVQHLEYPLWLSSLLSHQMNRSIDSLLPKVIAPGDDIGRISSILSKQFPFFHSNCLIKGSTTDSIAAFIATGASESGEATTSLGTTLAIKMISKVYVQDSLRGIYSHRLVNMNTNSSEVLWLVGGASNIGCAILGQEGFDSKELEELSNEINPLIDIDLHYYPLRSQGERFPINDPNKLPQLDPKPSLRKDYLHGILQSIGYIEKQGYDALMDLGASSLQKVYTVGGGAKNPMWILMRNRILKVPTKFVYKLFVLYLIRI